MVSIKNLTDFYLVFMQNRPEKCLMMFLIENKTFLTLETKIRVNPQILVISGKIRQDFLDLKKKTRFSRLYKQSDKESKKYFIDLFIFYFKSFALKNTKKSTEICRH